MIVAKCIGCRYRHEGDDITYDPCCQHPGKNIPCDLWSRRGLCGYELEQITVYRMIKDINDPAAKQATAYIEKIFSQKGIPKGALL